MDLDEFQRSVSLMSNADLERERARLRESIRKAERNPRLRRDEALLAEHQTAEVKLTVVQGEITARRSESA